MAMGIGVSETRHEINITPYIDVLLVLLICAILLSQRFVIQTQLAREGGPGRGDHSIVLELTNDGRYLVNTIPIPHDSLLVRLREIFAPRPAKILYVKAGGERLYSETIEAMDVAKSAGVQV